MKHTAADLVQMQSLPLDAKIKMTERRIQAWHEHYDGQVYVSFSGGKDSTVLKHIVDSLFSDVPSVFINTGLEFPEIRRFALAQPGVVRVDPEMRFYDVIRRYGYPVVSKEVSDCVHDARNALEKNPNASTFRIQRLRGTLKAPDGSPSKYNCAKWSFLLDAPFRVSAKCCDILKKNPAKNYQKQTGRFPITGTMAQESRMRWNKWIKYGCNAFDAKEPISAPMSFWTEQDVLRYIKETGIEIASVYGNIVEDESGLLRLTGEPRTGCMFCGFGVHCDASPNRFERMKITHPRQYDYCMKELGLAEVLDFMAIQH